MRAMQLENHRYVLLNMPLSIFVNLHVFAFISCFRLKYKHLNKEVLNRLSLTLRNVLNTFL